MTDDWCVHTADTTQLDFVVGKLFRLVETRRDCRQLVANSIHTADATQLDSWVASASAVCIGLKSDNKRHRDREMIRTFIELIVTKIRRVVCCGVVGTPSSSVQIFHEQAVGARVLRSHQTCCNRYTNGTSCHWENSSINVLCSGSGTSSNWVSTVV